MKVNVLSVKVNDNMKAELVEYANKKDLPISQVIRQAIREYLDKENG